MKERLKILIVDDEVARAIAIRSGIEATNELVEIVEVQTGAAAIAQLKQENFDCVFLKGRLPDGDGLTLVTRLRGFGHKMPVIVLTGLGDEQIAVELIKAGASDSIAQDKICAQTIARSFSNAMRIYQAEQEAAIASKRLKQSEERYRLVLEGSNDAIWDWDMINNQIYWNSRIEEIIGVSATELGITGTDFSSAVEKFYRLLYPEDRKKVWDAVKAHLCHNREFNLEFRLRHQSGEYRYCMTRGKAQRDSEGNPVRMAGIISDITPMKQAEEELRSRVEQMESIYQINSRLYRESQDASDNLRRAILILGEQQQQLRTLQRLTNLLNQRLTNLPELLQLMVQSVRDAIEGSQFCLIVLNNPQCDRLVLTVTSGTGTERLRLNDAFSNNGWLNQFISSNKADCFPFLDRFPECNSRVQDFTPNNQRLISDDSLPASLCGVTIQSPQGARLGVLAIGNWEDANAFDEEDRNFLVAVAEVAAIAIHNARLIKTLEEREERLASQNDLLANQNRELENQRQQIQLQNLQLMEAAKLKSQFLATMSHELRTPMNAIIGFSQLLLYASTRTRTVSKTPPLSSEQQNMVQRILDNGKHLLSLIDDILALSKIESGRLELEIEPINLANLVQLTVDELRSSAQDKQLELQINTCLSNPIVINDSIRLRQVLVNLISNAIKFTPAGIVQVEVWEPHPERIAFAVRDTGIGIAQENLEQIFETFRQVDQSLAKKYYGTGLGLAITKSLVQMMNGTIAVKSSLGKGSTFQLEIPRTVAVSHNQRQTKSKNRKIW